MITETRTRALRGSGIALFSFGVLAAGAGFAEAQANPRDPYDIESFNCADMDAYHIEKQENLRAGKIREKCLGLQKSEGGQEPGDPSGSSEPDSPDVYGGPDVNVHAPVNGAIQSESQSFRAGNTVIVTYNDLSGGSTGKGSRSTDGGVTFARLTGDPFGVGHGTNFGDPGIVFDALHNRWVAAFLAGGCGGQGVGTWTSSDGGATWSANGAAGCAVNSGAADRNALWVDSNPASPFFGRVYNSYNDFNIGGGALRANFSSDGGLTWSTPVSVNPGFERDIALTAAPNGHVFLAGMNEGGGGAANRINFMHRSTNGGVSWLAGVQTNPAFAPPGNVNCAGNSYFRVITPQMRHMGWGQPAAGSGNVVHYVYAAHGAGTDEGDIFYVRSTDLGVTWSAPLRLNTDAGTRAQWMPSVTVTTAGAVFANWYDRRDTANNDYWRYGRASLDNGATWQTDQQLSDAVIPQPAVQTGNCYAGDYDFWQSDGNIAQGSWLDSRGAPAGSQDVFHDSVDLPVGLNVTPATASVCAPANAVYNVAVTTFFTSPVTLSATGNPAGTTTSFVPNPVPPPGNSTFTIGNTGAGAPGTYNVNILGTAGAQSSNQTVVLNLFNAAPAAPTLTSPANGATNVATNPTFTWNAAAQGATYDIQIATDAGFTNIVASATGLTGTTYNGATLQNSTQYFWHVRGVNTCGAGVFSTTFSFTTIAPTATCIPGTNYTITSTTGAVIVPATDFVAGSNCDDCVNTVAIPFSIGVYDQTFNAVNISSNGNIQFTTTNTSFTNTCLPAAGFATSIHAHWDDLLLVTGTDGIYTRVSGTAPNRIFDIEWRGIYFSGGGNINLEVRLHENTPTFEVIYGTVTQTGTSATVGIQRDTGGLMTQFECNTGGLSAGQQLTFTCPVPVELFDFKVE